MAALTGGLSAAQLDSVRHATARLNIWHGPVRSGKTVSSLLSWWLFCASAPPGELAIVGASMDTIYRNVVVPMQDPALWGTQLARQVSYTARAPRGKILGRRFHVISGSDATSETRLRGLTLAGAYADEAVVLPENFWNMLLSRLSVEGARLFATTNPDAPAHWLRKRFLLRSDELDLAEFLFRIDDNPSLSQAYITALKSEYTGLFYKRFIEGKWVAAEGAIYDSFDEDTAVVDIVPPIASWLAAGVDYGTSNPTAAVLLGLGIDKRLYITSELWVDAKETGRQLTDAEQAARFGDWLAGAAIPGTRLRGVRPEHVVVDPAAASFKVQLWNDGWNVADADNAVVDGIRVTSSLLASGRLRIHRSCTRLIEALPAYAWDSRAQARGEDKPLKVDDHLPDALRYAVKSTRSLWHGQLREAA